MVFKIKIIDKAVGEKYQTNRLIDVRYLLNFYIDIYFKNSQVERKRSHIFSTTFFILSIAVFVKISILKSV